MWKGTPDKQAMSIEKPVKVINMKTLRQAPPVVRTNKLPWGGRQQTKERKEQMLTATNTINNRYVLRLDKEITLDSGIMWTKTLNSVLPHQKSATIVFFPQSFVVSGYSDSSFPTIFWISSTGFPGYELADGSITERMVPFPIDQVNSYVHEGTTNFNVTYSLKHEQVWEVSLGTVLNLQVSVDEDLTPLSELPTPLSIRLMIKNFGM